MSAWKLEDKYKECCHNDDCDSFDTCLECWDEWAERNLLMTNADYIRSMTDEELAKFFEGMHTICNICADSDLTCSEETIASGRCIKGITQWLKQPKENTDE